MRRARSGVPGWAGSRAGRRGGCVWGGARGEVGGGRLSQRLGGPQAEACARLQVPGSTGIAGCMLTAAQQTVASEDAASTCSQKSRAAAVEPACRWIPGLGRAGDAHVGQQVRIVAVLLPGEHRAEGVEQLGEVLQHPGVGGLGAVRLGLGLGVLSSVVVVMGPGHRGGGGGAADGVWHPWHVGPVQGSIKRQTSSLGA